MEKLYARVIIDISHEKVDRPFCYEVPELLRKEIEVGACVEVPFGKGNTLRKGYVIELMDVPDFDPNLIKEIQDVKTGVQVENKLIKLAHWIREEYGSTMIQALQTVLPVKQKIKQKENRILIRKCTQQDALEMAEACEKKHQGAKARVLRALAEDREISYTLLTQKLHISASTIQSLKKADLIEEVSERAYRNPLKDSTFLADKKVLSISQQKVVDDIWADYEQGVRKTYLIHGITGSGKTEVYMELIEKVVADGKSVIMLIPEIALTYQTVMRFQRRFGDRVSILNSTLSAGEKFDQCERAKKGEIDIMIGPRSALFAPFTQIGLILIDEEHETTYKSETMPKYHAREVAEELARLHGASVVLGSATPSMESYYKATVGEYGFFTLKERVTGGTLPSVYIEDLREELRKGNRSIFSDRLQELIRDRLAKKEQIMLFLNRRGYSGFISCRSCGHVIKCPHCDVSLSKHANGRMVCHYCGYEQPAVTACPNCGSKYVLGFKAGTEKIEEEFRRMFGEVSILRMDRDTTKTKDSYEEILSQFMEEKAQVLIGTQMIVKGHDFPKVTLVGILAADLSLGVNDYRAGERTFQLLTQAAGRAGRGVLPGEVVIQSYQPEHYSIRWAAKQNYESFYQEELMYRSLGGYPPIANMMMVQIFGEEENAGIAFGEKMKQLLKEFALEHRMVIIGPANAGIGKIKDVYRSCLILKHPNKEVLKKAKNQLEQWLSTCETEGKIVQFDFNPMNAF
ncbi:MAG: primosomal protein N' [Lachnospiraceae bacterium]|nr:primosomal protein N' [Lachnospiraceae bacterium]